MEIISSWLLSINCCDLCILEIFWGTTILASALLKPQIVCENNKTRQHYYCGPSMFTIEQPPPPPRIWHFSFWQDTGTFPTKLHQIVLHSLPSVVGVCETKCLTNGILYFYFKQTDQRNHKLFGEFLGEILLNLVKGCSIEVPHPLGNVFHRKHWQWRR